MKMIKTLAILAVILSVVVVSGCAQQPAKNATQASPAAQIKSADEASKTVVDTSKDVKVISDTLAGIDKSLAGK